MTMRKRLAGTGWRVYMNTKTEFGLELQNNESVWVKVEKFSADVGIDAGGEAFLPPAVALVLADKLREFAGGGA